MSFIKSKRENYAYRTHNISNHKTKNAREVRQICDAYPKTTDQPEGWRLDLGAFLGRRTGSEADVDRDTTDADNV